MFLAKVLSIVAVTTGIMNDIMLMANSMETMMDDVNAKQQVQTGYFVVEGRRGMNAMISYAYRLIFAFIS